MKNSFFLVFAFVLILNACAPARTQAVPTLFPSSDTPVPGSTATSSPTATQILSTPTTTPLPTIPTFTPTFDASTIVTVTPVEKAICPTAIPHENRDFDFLNVLPGIDWENRAHAEENMLNFLNTYGAEPLISYLQYNWKSEGRYYLFKDLTNDSLPELAISLTSFYIFSCKTGRYEKVFELPPDGRLWSPTIFLVKDNNRNGLPELIILIGTWSQGGRAYQVFEWSGTRFHNLVFSDDPYYLDGGELWMEGIGGNISSQDVNHDMVNELILDSGVPGWTIYYEGLPWRNKRTYYQWNGQSYVPWHYEFALPEFRFQAIQDGDLAVSQNEFDKALPLYQDAIFSEKLKDYSAEIRKNLQDNWMSQVGGVRPTPTPYPSDPTEYPRLAAYAYYRIMLLYIMRGYESDAGTIYNTLQQKFSNDQYGRPYVEMATAFWDAYRSSRKMYDGCAAAIQYAAEHPEILIPLGSDYHGWQSRQYKPEDVCPFR
jgi:hypothetical protein